MSRFPSYLAGMIGSDTGVVSLVDSDLRPMRSGAQRRKFRIVLHGASFETWNALQASLCERSQLQQFPVTIRWSRTDFGYSVIGVTKAEVVAGADTGRR